LKNYKPTGKKPRPPAPKQPSASKSNEPEITSDKPAKLYVLIKEATSDDKLKQLKQVLSRHGGTSEVILVLGEKKDNAVRLPFGVKLSDELNQEITELFDKDCVAVK